MTVFLENSFKCIDVISFLIFRNDFILNQSFLIKNFFLFLAALGLRRCTRALSSCGEWGLLLAAVRSPLIAVASLVAEHGR